MRRLARMLGMGSGSCAVGRVAKVRHGDACCVRKPSAVEAAERRLASGPTGTWDVSQVVELDDLMAECRSTGEDVILGGMHPILGAKMQVLLDPSKVEHAIKVVTNLDSSLSGIELKVCLYSRQLTICEQCFHSL